MSSKEIMQGIVKGAAFATAAALLAPVNVLFMLRGLWYVVAALGVAQIGLLAIGISIMASVTRKARK